MERSIGMSARGSGNSELFNSAEGIQRQEITCASWYFPPMNIPAQVSAGTYFFSYLSCEVSLSFYLFPLLDERWMDGRWVGYYLLFNKQPNIRYGLLLPKQTGYAYMKKSGKNEHPEGIV